MSARSGVVVDVHVRVLRTALLDEGEEVQQRLPLVAERVRPERGEPASGSTIPRGSRSPIARRPRCTAGRPRSRRTRRQRRASGSRRARAGPPHRRRCAAPAGLRFDLEARLTHQAVLRRPRHRGHGRGAVRQVVDRPHPGADQLRPLVEANAGDEHEVAMLGDLGRADRAAAAAAVARVAPGQLVVRRHPLGDHTLQLGPLRAVHGRDVGEVVRGGRPVAQDEVEPAGPSGCRAPASDRVGGELQEGADSWRDGRAWCRRPRTRRPRCG